MKIVRTDDYSSNSDLQHDYDMVRCTIDMTKNEFRKFKLKGPAHSNVVNPLLEDVIAKIGKKSVSTHVGYTKIDDEDLREILSNYFI